jgi:hypothetical protein
LARKARDTAEARKLSDFLRSEVIERHPALAVVTLHGGADVFDDLVELCVVVRKAQLFLQEVIANAREFVLAGTRDE